MVSIDFGELMRYIQFRMLICEG